MGRLWEAHSGNEADAHITGQPFPATPNGPYSHSYSYDVWGNLTQRQGWGGANASYNQSFTNNRRTGSNYDAAGNITSDGAQSFTYDTASRQVAAAGLSMEYDGNGLRAKKVESDFETTTYYLRSSVLGGQVVAEYDGGGNSTRGYVYLGAQLLAVQQGAAVHWVHQDPVTKSQRVTSQSGAVESTVDLDPWGGETTVGVNAAFQPRRFTTYERDVNASDDAMARRYNRWWSRFDQPDPYGGSYSLADPQSFNRYSYVQNDPVNFVDPSGLDGEGIVLPGETVEIYDTIDQGIPHSGTVSGLLRGEGRDLVEEVNVDGPSPGGGGGGINLQNSPMASRNQQGPNHPRCQALAKTIANLQSSLISHASALIHNPLRLPEFSPTGDIRGGVTGHRDRLVDEADILAKRIQEYKDNCGGGNPPSVPPANPPRSYRAQSTNFPNGQYRVSVSTAVGVGLGIVLVGGCIAFWEVCLPAVGTAAGTAAVGR